MNLNMCLFLHCSVDLSLITNKHQHCSNCIMPAFMKFHNPPFEKKFGHRADAAPLLYRDRRPWIGSNSYCCAYMVEANPQTKSDRNPKKLCGRTYVRRDTPEFLSIRLSAIDDLKWGVEVSNYGAFRHQCKAKNHIFGGNQANLKECLNEQLL